MDNSERIRSFDHIASSYDATFTDTPVGRYQRDVTTGIMDRLFKPGMTALEIGCGSGVDAAYLAERGVRVTATDASPEMTALTRRRISACGLDDMVTTRCVAAQELEDCTFPSRFDGLFSNFGALNTLSDLRPLNRIIARHLRPGGVAVLCLMGRWCLWEILTHLASGRARTAFRRMGVNGATARIGGQTIRVFYPSPGQLTDICRPWCEPVGLTGVGVFIPPSYMNPFVSRYPRLFSLLARFEKPVCRLFPFKWLGDHYCLELRRRENDIG